MKKPAQRKMLRNRKAKKWEYFITERLPEEWWPKIASVVWWDFVSSDGFITSKWFHETMRKYDYDDSMDKGTLAAALTLIGYPKAQTNMIKPTFHDKLKEK